MAYWQRLPQKILNNTIGSVTYVTPRPQPTDRLNNLLGYVFEARTASGVNTIPLCTIFLKVTELGLLVMMKPLSCFFYSIFYLHLLPSL